MRVQNALPPTQQNNSAYQMKQQDVTGSRQTFLWAEIVRFRPVGSTEETVGTNYETDTSPKATS